MLDISTFSLIFVMIGFIAVSIIIVHHHKYSDMVRRKKGEVEAYSQKINQKIEAVEREIVDLKIQIETLDDEIEIEKG